jgi:hypothetical protein
VEDKTMASKIRPARMAAMHVQWGDVIVQAPSDGGAVIGTVIEVQGAINDGFRFVIRGPRNSRVVWPPESRQPVAAARSVWVHVPAGSA